MAQRCGRIGGQRRFGLLAAALGALLAANCSGDDAGICSTGSEGCPCADGDICYEGLSCRSDLCVDLDGEDPGESGGAGSGGGSEQAGEGGDSGTPTAGEGGAVTGASGAGGKAAGTGGASATGGSAPEGGEPSTGGTATMGGGSGGSAPASGGASSGGDAGAPSGTGGTVPDGQCDVSQPFVEVTDVSGLNTEYHEASPRLTPDELTVVFYSRQPDDDGMTDADVYIAERERVIDSFGTPQPLPFNQEERDEMGPWLAEDGLTVLFDFGAGQGEGADYDRTLAISERGSSLGVFEPEEELGAGFAPFVVGGADGTFYFLNPSGQGGINQVSLSGWSPLDDVFEVVPPVSQRFAISRDELTVYFGDGPSGPAGIQIATRTSTSQPFGTPSVVTELDSFNPLGGGWLSPDQCRLYFDIDLDGVSGGNDGDIMVAERAPP